MDSLNKLSGFQAPIFTEVTDAQPVQDTSATSPVNQGIGGLQDSFEVLQPGNLDLSSFTTPTSTNTGNTTEGGTVEASSVFDIITADIGNVSKLESTIQVQPNKWDVIEVLVREARKSPPDTTRMIQQLLGLTPQMRKEVLTELSNEGELKRVLSSMTNNSNGTATPYLLQRLIQDAKNDPQVKPFLNEAYESMSNQMRNQKNTDALRNYLNITPREDLKFLPEDLIEKMQTDALSAGTMMDLTSWQSLQEAKYEKQGDRDAFSKATHEAHEKFNAIPTTDPNFGKYASFYSYWGAEKLNNIMQQDPQQFKNIINTMKNNDSESLSSFLAGICSRIQYGSDTNQNTHDLTNLMQGAVNTIQESFENGGWNGASDELAVINQTVLKLGSHDQAVQTLSKLPPNILLDLSLMEDSIYRDPEVKNIINEALAISKQNF